MTVMRNERKYTAVFTHQSSFPPNFFWVRIWEARGEVEESIFTCKMAEILPLNALPVWFVCLLLTVVTLNALMTTVLFVFFLVPIALKKGLPFFAIYIYIYI